MNPHLARRYFPSQPEVAPRVYDDSFEKIKSPNTYRIFCLGESSMQGFPYEYNGALPRLLKDQLMQRIPNKNIEVINLGIAAVNSYTVLDLVKEVVEYSPDLLIIYLGHNEFYGSFGVGSIEYLGTNRGFINVYLKISRLKLFQLMRDIIKAVSTIFKKDFNALPPQALMELMAREQSIPYQSELYQLAKENFRQNLSEILQTCKSHNVPVLLSTVVSNVREQFPFLSEFSPLTSKPQQEEWLRYYEAALQFAQSDSCEQALIEFRRALAIDSNRADLHFYIGQCLEQLGHYAEAKHHYERARDLDVLRFRASGEFNEIIRTTGKLHGAWIADVVKTFEDSSAHGLIGNRWILEHLHPNIDGYFLIAKEYVRLMHEHGCIVPSNQWLPPWDDDVAKANSFMTSFDFEVSFIRLDHLLHHWPFAEPESTRYVPQSEEGKLALEYMQGKITWEDAHYQLAESYKKQGRFIDAAREYLAIGKVMWNDYHPVMLAGDINMLMNDYENAEYNYMRAIQRSKNQYTLIRIGALNLALARPDSAIYYFRAALEFDRQAQSKFEKQARIEVRYQLAAAYAANGELSRARDEILLLLADAPNFTPAQVMLDTLNKRIKGLSR